jgi:hypothetical protein
MKGLEYSSYRKHPDGLQYEHISKNVLVPSVKVLYPDGVVQFQHDHSFIYGSRVVQEWLSRQANVEFIDWPPQALDMNLSRICGVR